MNQHQRSFGVVFRELSLSNPILATASLGGLGTNLKDGVLWGLMPMFLKAKGLALDQIGVVVALYPAVWGLTQVLFGPMSDRTGRKTLIVSGYALQATGIVGLLVGETYTAYLAASFLIGLGTAMVYPTLLALVSDNAASEWRASALGVYRFWRDFGYVCGAITAGLIADFLGIPSAFTVTLFVLIIILVVFILRVKENRSAADRQH